MRRNDELIGEIEEAEALLSRLETQQGQARTRLAALREELASQERAPPGIRVQLPATLPQPAPRNPEEKVRLFRQLFRGRVAVFPTRFPVPMTEMEGSSKDSRSGGTCQIIAPWSPSFLQRANSAMAASMS